MTVTADGKVLLYKDYSTLNPNPLKSQGKIYLRQMGLNSGVKFKNVSLTTAVAEVETDQVEEIDPTTVYTKPAVAAAEELAKAAMENAEDPFGVIWDHYGWEPVYLYSNALDYTTGWATMMLADAANNKYTQNGSADSPLSAVGDGYQVLLNANSYNTEYWWDMAGLQYKAPEDGDYVLTCAILTPVFGENGSFTDASKMEGRVVVTLNGKKIWPADTEFSSVTQSKFPSFRPLKVSMKEGDVLRFESYGALIGGNGKENTNDMNYKFKNQVVFSPTVAQIVDEPWVEPDPDPDEPSEEPTGPVRPQVPDNTKQNLKVLFIGNSHTEVNNVPGLFKSMAQKAGYQVTVNMFTWGGCTMDRYADLTDGAGQDAQGQIRNGNYDIVFLQEGRNRTAEQTRPALDILVPLIRECGAEPYFYVVGGPKQTYEDFNPEFISRFETLSEVYGVKSAFQAVAMNKVLAEDPTINLWGADEAHFSRMGSLLSALVCFGTLYRESTIDLYTAGLNANVANLLQRAADATVFGDGTTVSGSLTTYGNADENTTVELVRGDKVVQSTTGKTSFTLSGILGGTYILRVKKPYHVPREYSITVRDNGIEKSVKLLMYGDTREDGVVNVLDLIRAKKNLLTDNPDPNGVLDFDADGQVNATDLTKFRKLLVGSLKREDLPEKPYVGE
ncbi:MAG: dockerin type I repeat-containing protein [Clostridia bacterium]|nr:dockerin type I repeat-containing protein [Clostridia bacterium]